MSSNSFFSKLKLIIFVIILINANNVELNGVFRIDSATNGNSLTDENYSLQFTKQKEKRSHSEL